MRSLLQAHDWQAIVEGYGPLVWRTAYRLLGNHADAADCFQETFLTALEISRRQHVRNLPGLLAHLATTRSIDRMRQRILQERHENDARDSAPRDEGADPLEHVEALDLGGYLRVAIGQLPPQEANVFCLRYLSEMSYLQIARELEIGVNAVGVSLHRAKARLRKLLAATSVKDEVSHEAR